MEIVEQSNNDNTVVLRLVVQQLITKSTARQLNHEGMTADINDQNERKRYGYESKTCFLHQRAEVMSERNDKIYQSLNLL